MRAAPVPPPGVLSGPQRRFLFDFAIAGGWYHGLAGVREELAPGEILRLRAEPENPHDADAVAVHRTDGLMLGYIPRAANAPVARLLKLGAPVEAVIVGPIAFGPYDNEPEDFAFTSVTEGDPRIRLVLAG